MLPRSKRQARWESNVSEPPNTAKDPQRDDMNFAALLLEFRFERAIHRKIHSSTDAHCMQVSYVL